MQIGSALVCATPVIATAVSARVNPTIWHSSSSASACALGAEGRELDCDCRDVASAGDGREAPSGLRALHSAHSFARESFNMPQQRHGGASIFSGRLRFLDHAPPPSARAWVWSEAAASSSLSSCVRSTCLDGSIAAHARATPPVRLATQRPACQVTPGGLQNMQNRSVWVSSSSSGGAGPQLRQAGPFQHACGRFDSPHVHM
jgi:hypothetical protein